MQCAVSNAGQALCQERDAPRLSIATGEKRWETEVMSCMALFIAIGDDDGNDKFFSREVPLARRPVKLTNQPTPLRLDLVN